MSEPICNHAHAVQVYKLRDHQNWDDLTRAAWSCSKCLPKMRRWVSAQTGVVIQEMFDA